MFVLINNFILSIFKSYFGILVLAAQEGKVLICENKNFQTVDGRIKSAFSDSLSCINRKVLKESEMLYGCGLRLDFHFSFLIF